MPDNPFHLLTASEAEKKFGKKFFYRQKIYRLAEKKKIPNFTLRGRQCFLGAHVLKAFLHGLGLKIKKQFPELDSSSIRVFYDTVNEKRIVIDGILGGSVSINTDEETEGGLLKKIVHVIEWVSSQEPDREPTKAAKIKKKTSRKQAKKDSSLTNVLPEEIVWLRVDAKEVQGVEVKSHILISIPSIAQFIGVRSNNFTRWLTKTSFAEYILSVHPRHFHGAQGWVPWKKGVVTGYTTVIPFELVPEIIVAFKQSGNKPKYQEKAELLYQLSKNTLEAVGIAISGDKDKAASELARVGRGLGLTAADQVIGIFKQYETREFQVKTTKQLRGKIKSMGGNYAITIGSLTFGITDKYPTKWLTLGKSRNLPSKITTSGREVMRELSPGDSVGMTFGEKHYTKDPTMPEAIKTGRQGKEFYKRLKDVGLLDDPPTRKQLSSSNAA